MSGTPWFKTNEFKVGLAILAIGGIGTVVYDRVTSATIFTTFLFALEWCWSFVIFILAYPVKIYWIIIAIAALIGFLYIISLFDREKAKMPDFHAYQTDNLKRWKWSWEYRPTSNGYRIENLIPFCSSCGFPMRYGKGYWNDINVECPKCKKYIQDSEKEDIMDIQMMIEHKINTRQFPGA